MNSSRASSKVGTRAAPLPPSTNCTTSALITGAVKMHLFHRLSGHHLLEELKLLLSERQPKQAIQRLAEFELLTFIHPKLSWSERLRTLLDAYAPTAGNVVS